MAGPAVLPAALGRLVALVVRRAWVTLLVCAALTAAAWHYTVANIGINTDTGDMISPDLEWRQRYLDYKAAFPLDSSTLTIVIDGDSVDAAEAGAASLAGALRAPGAGFEWVYAPRLEPFFRRNGLLYIDPDELESLAARLVSAQPLLGRLSDEPRASALFELLADLIAERERVDPMTLARLMDEVRAVLDAAGSAAPRQLAWRELISATPATRSDRRRFLTVKPILDYSELLPAGPAIDTIRRAATRLGLTAERGYRVRVTGGTAMAHEELDTVSSGMALAGGVALVLVLGVLLLGLRSWQATLAALVTLLMGLTWTGAFAAAAVGHLNLISVAFAVLYIGLGVDYAVHFSLRHAELMAEGLAPDLALVRAAEDVGSSLALCAVTTGIGFFAFIPTDFAGVSELGIISGTGMFISLAASLTVLPAALAVLRAPPGVVGGRSCSARRRRIGRRPLLIGALVVAVLSGWQATGVRFDFNPINLRDPQTESVATYLELLADTEVGPWRLDALVAPAEVPALAERLKRLPDVNDTASVLDLVPSKQTEKLAIIDDLALVLGPSLGMAKAGPRPDPVATERALARLAAALQAAPAAVADGATGRMGASVQAFANRLRAAGGGEGDALLADLEARLFAHLPAQMSQLSDSLNAERVELARLPQTLRERWITADGRWRLEIAPEEDLSDNDALARFVTAVHSVAPQATGTPEVNLGAGNVVVAAFTQAFLSAAVIILVLLGAVMRRPVDVALVLAPLGLAALATAATMAALGIPFNFANVIALPLLLGIGVDNGVHMVHRMRAAPPGPGGLLATSTSRAIVLSALTTVCGFGNLAYSPHPGTASMGQVLTIGLALTVIATLVVLPALLESGRAPDHGGGR